RLRTMVSLPLRSATRTALGLVHQLLFLGRRLRLGLIRGSFDPPRMVGLSIPLQGRRSTSLRVKATQTRRVSSSLARSHLQRWLRLTTHSLSHLVPPWKVCMHLTPTLSSRWLTVHARLPFPPAQRHTPPPPSVLMPPRYRT